MDQRSVTRRLAATAAAFALSILPVRAAADTVDTPVTLADAELDDVTAGQPPAFVLAAGHGPPFARAGGPTADPGVSISIKNVRFTVKIKDSDVNLATVLQLNLLGNAVQTASATAVQTGG